MTARTDKPDPIDSLVERNRVLSDTVHQLEAQVRVLQAALSHRDKDNPKEAFFNVILRVCIKAETHASALDRVLQMLRYGIDSECAHHGDDAGPDSHEGAVVGFPDINSLEVPATAPIGISSLESEDEVLYRAVTAAARGL